MNKIKKMLPYLLAYIFAFYILPLTRLYLLLLVLVIPVICLIISLIYGIKNKFAPLQLLFPVFSGILFIPAIFIFYNYSAWVYIIAYMVISFVGNTAGYSMAKLNRRNNKNKINDFSKKFR